MKLNIVFSRHARRQMRWREISEEEVKLALSAYDEMEDSVKGRKNVFKLIGKRYIKVIFKEEDGKYVVITALVKR